MNNSEIQINSYPYIPTEKDYAYIAGLIEAEGSFLIKKVKQKTRRKWGYRVCISIAMRERECLDYLVKIFPANINKTKNIYYVRYLAIQTKEIISKIYLYLTFKKKQADILLQMINLKEDYGDTNIKMSHNYEDLKIKLSSIREMQNEPELNILNYSEIQKEIKLSYLAGIIDGEGSFGIYNKRGFMVCRFSLCMTNMEPHLIIKELFSGNINRYNYNKKYKDNFVIQYSCKRVNGNFYNFLITIIPYLKLKKEQASLCINFIEKYKNISSEEKQEFVIKCKTEKNNKQLGESVIRPITILN